jgi:lipoprotein-releasing system permease protein
LLTALEVEGVVTSLILGFIVVLTVLLLLGVLYSMVREKRRDVGILRSMGIGRGRLIGVFTVYGGVLGVAGAAGGVALGVILVRNIDAITDWLHATFGFSVFNPQVFSFRGLPAILDPGRVAVIGVAAGVLAILAAGATAWRAASLEPSTCLNYE